MDAVGGVSQTTAGVTANNNVIGKDVFLRMLVAQLKNQDPLNPMNGTEFAAQLAQFSSLDQLTNISTQIGAMNTNMAAVNSGQLVGFIGNEITYQGNRFQAAGSSQTLNYSLSGDAQKGTVKIYDDKGDLVRTLTFGNQKAGSNSVVWDSSGRSGTFTFEVSAQDQNGKDVSATTLITGQVTGVHFQSGTPYLSVNGQDVAFANVISVKKSSS
jgi:flagellar basal-body rod modification protein FlgD